MADVTNSPKSKDASSSQSEVGFFDFRFAPAADVDPLALLGNAHLALHHHMAPADGGFDLEADEDD